MVKLVLLIVIIFLSSCIFLPDKKMKMKRVPNYGGWLKLDGYYYHELEDEEPTINTFFLYDNGIILYARAIKLADLERKEREFSSGLFHEGINKSKTGWGVYEIKDGLIQYEMWGASNGGPLYTFILYGEILNDTTFIVKKSMNHYSNVISEKNLNYHYKKFSPKPDSTNKWIN